ncbi:MAG: DUF4198 domain-containing protein [Hyphomonadaceae bacterium]|nr:DUF4198 domain-containing protein [Hyphomonadaceae bacterium]
MKRSLLAFAVALGAVALSPAAATAHRAWLLPSDTVLSGADPWVGVDAAISNTLFHADHNAMRLDAVMITAPDGARVLPENVGQARYRATFDVHLRQPGTYKIANVMQGASARFRIDGEERMWRGAAKDLAAAVPAGATDVRRTESLNRVETFVTRGAPTRTVFALTNAGLELAPITHPNDLAAGETARFRLLLDGRPAGGLKVTVAPGGARYRDDPAETEIAADAEGVIAITWPAAGMYWLNAAQRDLPGAAPGAVRNVQYTAVLQVLP